jgi:hypothetical protein
MRIKFVKIGIEAVKRLAMGKKEKDTELISSILFHVNWCRGTESNCRHGDFQSPALPTELPRLFETLFLRNLSLLNP